MKLTAEETLRIAHLAKLDLTEAEVDSFGSQIGGVLEYMQMLEEVDTSGVTVTDQVTGMHSIVREDVAMEYPEHLRKKILALAPVNSEGLVVAPHKVQ